LVLGSAQLRVGWGVVMRLTKRTLDSLKPEPKPSFAYDSDVPGFGVRIAPSGVKSFVLDYRPRANGQAAGRNIAPKRFTIGRYGPLAPDQAREMAMALLVQIHAGVDPQIEKAGRRAALTVNMLADAFLTQHVALNCKPRTAEAHQSALNRLKARHGNIRATELTRAQVAKLHLDMSTTPYLANRFRAVVSSLYGWADRQGLLPEGHANPASRIQRYREQSRERFLSTDELGRLGDALREVSIRTLSQRCACCF
jgi:hypothetical protein